MQAGNLDSLVHLKQVQADIREWYEQESRKVVLHSWVDNVQLSEKVRIFHNVQHKKMVKRSSILRLETSDGIMEGHQACSNFLQKELSSLLLNPAILDPAAQTSLLAEVKPVFTEADNLRMKKLPNKDFVYQVVTAIAEGNPLPTSMRTCLMVYGSKPKNL